MLLLLVTLLEQVRLSISQIDDHLPKQTIRPSEPRSRPVRLVVAIDGLVHQSKATRRSHENLDAFLNFFVVIRGQDLGDDAHRPSHARAKVRAARSVDDGTVGVVGVALAEDEFTGVLVDLVRSREVAQVRDAEKGGEVGVILLNVSKSYSIQHLEKGGRHTIRLYEPKPSISYA